MDTKKARGQPQRAIGEPMQMKTSAPEGATLYLMPPKRKASDGDPQEFTPSTLRTDPGERSLLFWPGGATEPHPKHFLKQITSPGANEEHPAYFVTLDVEREQKARNEFAAELGARLRALRGERRREDIAQYLGRHHNTIAKFERGEAVPDAWELIRLSRLYEIPAEQLLDVGAVLPTSHDGVGKEFVLVPEYGVRATAPVEADDVVGRFAFRRSWLDSRGIQPQDLAVVSAEGDSMEPTVRDNDILLVDTSVRTVRADGIYLIEQSGELRCKRLQAMIGGGVRIRSDNEKYETEVLSADQAALLRVVAKVIWIGGER